MLYENYRRRRLETQGFSDMDDNNQPQTFHTSYHAKRLAQNREQLILEEEVNTDYIRRVREAERQFAADEKELMVKYELLRQEEIQLRNEIIEAKKKLYEDQNELTMRRQQLLVSPIFNSATNPSLNKRKKPFERRLTLR